MADIKLQIGCFLVSLYYLAIYVRDTSGKNKLKCHSLFSAILAITPYAIFFDGITALTVNHLDTVPASVNLILHALFFITEDLLIILVYAYVLEMIYGRKYNRKRYLMFIPGVVSMLVILAFLGKLYYVHGEHTNYSMGISVVACYVSLVFHFLYLSVLLIKYHKMIEKHKKVNVFIYIGFSFEIVTIQVIFPETLISAMLPVASIICFYENFENPSLRRLRKYNAEMVTGFATLVENRDNSTGGHIKRTGEYVSVIIEEMKTVPEYNEQLTADYVRNVINAAPMHDIGKIATPDYILKKPARLEEAECEIMRQHAAVGSEIIKKTFAKLNDPEYLQIAYEVARYHHEKWDGSGYPEGLAGEEIPLHARIMAIADVFDAVSADRCYRKALPLEQCFDTIKSGADKEFDPRLVELFLAVKERVSEVYYENKNNVE